MSDGGVVALTGFLFQLLASGATILRSPAENAVLALEQADEDAALIADGAEVVLQFKYSSVNDEIDPSDLAKILTNLETHTVGKPDAKWKLSTNRALSVTAKKLCQKQTDDLGKPPKNSASNYETIRRLRDRLEIAHETFDTAMTALRSEADRFGLSEQEVNEGASRIVSRFLNLVAGLGSNAVISRAQVVEELVNIRQPKSLIAADRYQDLALELEQYHRQHVHNSLISESVSRSSLRQIFDDDDVVIVTGPGGSGKSTAVLRAIYDHLLSQQKLGMALCSEIGDTVESKITAWRGGLELLEPENLDKCFERLCIANKTSVSPFVFIILDGYEEEGWGSGGRAETLLQVRNHIRSSPRYRSGSPRPKIVVTCRNYSDVRTKYSAGFEAENLSRPREIALSEFSVAELREVWGKWFFGMPFPSPASQPAGFESVDSEYSDISSELPVIFRMLISPVFLRIFQVVAKKDKAVAQAALAGDVGARDHLLHLYFEWFCEKVSIRSNIAKGDSLGALQTVAQQSGGSGPFERQSQWIEVIRDKGWMTHREAVRLFENAATCGLIDTTQAAQGQVPAPNSGPAKWYWRNLFVRDYLAGQT